MCAIEWEAERLNWEGIRCLEQADIGRLSRDGLMPIRSATRMLIAELVKK